MNLSYITKQTISIVHKNKFLNNRQQLTKNPITKKQKNKKTLVFIALIINIFLLPPLVLANPTFLPLTPGMLGIGAGKGYSDTDKDVSSNFGFPVGSILISYSTVDVRNKNGTLFFHMEGAAEPNAPAVWTVKYSEDRFFRAEHGKSLSKHKRDQFTATDGKAYNRSGVLAAGLSANNNGNTYYVENTTNAKINAGDDFRWTSTTKDNQFNFSYNSTANSQGGKGSRYEVMLDVSTTNSDYADAPQSYGNPSHVLSDNLYIGSLKPDAELESIYTYNATGDGAKHDTQGEDDGAPNIDDNEWKPYLFPILKESASNYSVPIRVTNSSGSVATLFAWIDFNKNGTFDNNESTSVAVNHGANNTPVTLNWNSIPNDIQIGTTFIRLRLTTDNSVTLTTPTNEAQDGEVEDYTIAVAQDIPPSSPNVTILTGAEPRSCDTVIFEDDFNDLPSGTYLGEHRPDRAAIRDWIITGGGQETYAKTVHLNTVYAATLGYTFADHGTSIYLGNGSVRRVHPPIASGVLSFGTDNRLLTPIEAIEIRDIPDDDPQGTEADASQWGPEAVTFSHTITTEVGKTYRLYFKALPELGDYEAGIIRIDTPSGSVHVKTPGKTEGGMIKYGIEFTANTTSSTISFINYGHISGNSSGYCSPWTEAWCTVGGTTVHSNEVTIDDVVITESNCDNVCDINALTTGIYSSASVQVNSKRLNTATRLYQSQFNVETWEGYLLSYDLKTANNNQHGNTKNLKWDSVDQLAAHSQRNIFSYNPLLSNTNGIVFAWDNLNADQKLLLQGSGNSCNNITTWNGPTTYHLNDIVKLNNIRYKAVVNSTTWNNPTLDEHNMATTQWGKWITLGPCSGGSNSTPQNLIAWVRGDQSQEKTASNSSGVFHQRTRLLGDIIHSSPTYVGRYEDFNYVKLSGTEGTSYTGFLTTKRNQTPMVYVGSNDGMLHGFNAATGDEHFAYIPNEVIAKFTTISATNYGCHEADCLEHQALVDGELTVGDAYINNTWQSVLLGTLGAGGKGLFALNVNDPTNFSATNVMWELSANQAANSASTYANHLGNTIPHPSIVRLHDGSWAAVISNGYDSANHQAVLLLIDISNGHLIKAINTEKGNADTPNGLSSPIPIDTNGDRITDFIYAGDLLGNLWKFDLRDSNPDNWAIAYTDASSPAPLFTACETSACTRVQPITAKPQVGKHPDGGYMVYFGTGKYADPSDNVSGIPDMEALYGIWDNNSRVTSINSLVLQTVLQESTLSSDLNVRITSNNSVDYASKKGWYLKLLKADGSKEGERIISQALLRGGKLILTTLIPPENCGWNGLSWLLEINAVNGQRLSQPVLDINNDREINQNDKAAYNNKTEIPSGVQTPSLGLVLHAPSIINHSANTEGKYLSGSTGKVGMIREATSKASGRQSWWQVR